jgi:SPP1 gp7 family putative phage head morphogenesis protein
MGYFEPRLRDVARADARLTRHTVDLDALEVHVLRQVPEHVGPAFDRMAGAVEKANERGTVTLLGIRPPRTRIAERIAQARDANIRLVENAGRVYARDVRAIFDDPDAIGLRVEELRDRLLARGNVSESRAELVARDQTQKLAGTVNQIRQENAGVTQYVWSTSRDERVRPSHDALDGEIFDWATPPPETGHPGQDFQCRCVALPVVTELVGL